MPGLGFRKGATLVMFGLLFLLCSPSRAWTSFPLDEENVFCLYHWFSGERMSDQDIEDLCLALGRPVFSAYKPAEMFVRPTIRAVRERLLQRMKEYGSSPVFTWRFEAKPRRDRLGLRDLDLTAELPHATSLIRSALPERDRESILGILHGALGKRTDLSNGPVRIVIKARPQGIDRHLERRITAGEEMRIPIRMVVFHPLEIEVVEGSQAGGSECQNRDNRAGNQTPEAGGFSCIRKEFAP